MQLFGFITDFDARKMQKIYLALFAKKSETAFTSLTNVNGVGRLYRDFEG
jgi:hypothetical protein